MSDDDLFRLIALLAVVLLVAPAAFRLRPQMADGTLKAGALLVGLGIILALGYWLFGG